MNVNDPSRSSQGSSAATARVRLSSGAERPSSADDSHLAELLRSLRALAADSPERQAKMEGLMRAYAAGDLEVDAEGTASAMIDDAMARRRR